jgi:hypothetical protein
VSVHPVEKLWREVGLPEYFLGNGGTNTKLYALYDAIRSSSLGGKACREALELADQVLSCAPFSTEIWPNGMHPNEGIKQIRSALASLPSSELVRETEHRDALLAALSALNNPLNVSLRDRAFGAINRALYTLPRPELGGDK